MSFTGKATYSAGSNLPELAEDVNDLVSVVSPFETPLLDALGDPLRPARSTVHEWLEDTLLGNSDTLAESSISEPTTQNSFTVNDISLYRVGDQLRLVGTDELMLVSQVDTANATLGVVRGYGGSTVGSLTPSAKLLILGNAALEGADASSARFTSRTRKVNYTQIFSSTVEVSGSELAVRQLAVADELEYLKQARLRELLRDLESTVVNGRAPAATPQGSASVRRSMNGLLAQITANVFTPGVGGFPTGASLTETQLNTALREVWTNSAARIDLIAVGGQEKRAINSFIGTERRYYNAADGVFHDGIAAYESDFGVCRVVLCRSVPRGTVLLLDSSRIEVMPLAGRSFHYRPLATTGDREAGQIIGEYTLELRNENAHAVIKGFSS